MLLTQLQIKQAKPQDKDYKLGDGGGMYLLVKKTGAKWWRLEFRGQGRVPGTVYGIPIIFVNGLLEG